MSLLSGIANEIPDDQEVTGILHPLDDPDLVFDPLLIDLDRILQRATVGHALQMLQPVLKPVAHDLRKIGIDRESRRNLEFRKRIVDLLQFQIAALGDFHGLIEDVGNLSEDPVHFLPVLEIELVGVELHAVRVVDRLAGLDAKKEVVGTAVVLVHVVAVVAGDGSDAGSLGDLQHVGNDLALLLQPVIVDLKKKPILAEDVLVFRCGALRLIESAHQHVGRDFPVQACGKSDQAFAVFPQQCLVDARLVIEPFEVGLGNKLHEILIAAFVLTQNDQVIRSAACRDRDPCDRFSRRTFRNR